MWFDSTLVEGVNFSNAPGRPELIYGSAFFPWPEPVDLVSGDQLAIVLRADLVDEAYVWRWNTRVLASDGGRVKADFRQSTFYGVPLPLSQLKKRAAEYSPKLNRNGEVDQLVLTLTECWWAGRITSLTGRLMAYRAVDNHVCERVRGFLRRRRKVSSRGARRFSRQVVRKPG